MSSNSSKKAVTRFSIQFNRANPDHLQVVDILNQYKRFDKAQYIADAVLHYENCNMTPVSKRVVIDEKHIETVVYRILRSRAENVADTPSDYDTVNQVELSIQNIEEIDFDNSIETLGEDGFKVVASALEMFRKK